VKEHKDEGFCDVDGCLFCGRTPLPPPLPPLWGPLDVAGKTWGPCTVKLGRCSCANHELHMLQEFKVCIHPRERGRERGGGGEEQPCGSCFSRLGSAASAHQQGV
jgi:hypothetical protein